MRLALECPTDLLEEIQPLADFDWILTHLVLENPEYARFYKASSNFKVLDNSVNELLEPCSLEDMERMADIVDPDLIVPPDYLGDHLSTKTALDKSLRLFGREKILPVVQGSTPEDVVECTRHIFFLDFYRLAVPYDILCKRTDSLETMAKRRLEVVSRIIEIAPVGVHIHLLGMTTLEELKVHNRGWVRSVDTGSPILHGLFGLRYGRDSLLSKERPTLEQMPDEKDIPTSRLADAYYNIAYLRKIVGGDR